jgi:hypothetical protein
VPATSLNGKVANISAEALVELRAGLDQKVAERKQLFGKSHAQALRLAAQMENDPVSANDYLSRVTWQDTSVRSMAQAADALGKIATMLGVPVEALWDKIPTVTKLDTDEWKKMASRAAGRQTITALAAAAAAARQDPAVADLSTRRANAG